MQRLVSYYTIICARELVLLHRTLWYTKISKSKVAGVDCRLGKGPECGQARRIWPCSRDSQDVLSKWPMFPFPVFNGRVREMYTSAVLKPQCKLNGVGHKHGGSMYYDHRAGQEPPLDTQERKRHININPDREARVQSFMCYPRNPKNIHLFVRIPDWEDQWPGRLDKVLCAKVLCAFSAP